MKLLFSPSVQIVDDGQGDVLLYVDERLSHRMSGKSVRALVDDVLPLLDGSRTRDEVCAALAIRLGETTIDALLHRLTQLRLLRRVHAAPIPGSVPAFIARATDDPEAAWTRARAHPITLIGPSAATREIWQDALRGAGFEAVRCVEPAGADPSALVAESFVIAVDEDEQVLRPVLLELDRAALATQRAWLLVRFTRADEAWLGPIFDPGEACYRCFLDRWRANLKSAREAERLVHWRATHPSTVPPYMPHVMQVAGTIAYEAMRWLVGVEASPLASAVRIVDLRSQEIDVHRVLRHPLCPACGRAGIARPVPWEEDVLRIEVISPR